MHIACGIHPRLEYRKGENCLCEMWRFIFSRLMHCRGYYSKIFHNVVVCCLLRVSYFEVLSAVTTSPKEGHVCTVFAYGYWVLYLIFGRVMIIGQHLFYSFPDIRLIEVKGPGGHLELLTADRCPEGAIKMFLSWCNVWIGELTKRLASSMKDNAC